MWSWIYLRAIKLSVSRFSTKSLPLTLNPLSMVALPWGKIINIFSTFRNMTNLLVSQKNCINCKKLWSASSSNLTMESLFSFNVIESTVLKPKFCYIRFPTWQLFKTVYTAFREFFETSALRILRIPPWSLETNISGTFQTKIRANFFPLQACEDLPPKTPMLNWKTFMLVIFFLPVSLFNLYCKPNRKSALLISFWFVLSATSGFISKLADLALSSTSFLINFALNNLEKVPRLSARKGTIRLFVWHRTRKEFSVLTMSSKNCNFRGTSRSFWIEQSVWSNWCLLQSFLFLAFFFSEDLSKVDGFNNTGPNLSYSRCYPLVFNSTMYTEL